MCLYVESYLSKEVDATPLLQMLSLLCYSFCAVLMLVQIKNFDIVCTYTAFSLFSLWWNQHTQHAQTLHTHYNQAVLLRSHQVRRWHTRSCGIAFDSQNLSPKPRIRIRPEQPRYLNRKQRRRQKDFRNHLFILEFDSKNLNRFFRIKNLFPFLFRNEILNFWFWRIDSWESRIGNRVCEKPLILKFPYMSEYTTFLSLSNWNTIYFSSIASVKADNGLSPLLRPNLFSMER